MDVYTATLTVSWLAAVGLAVYTLAVLGRLPPGPDIVEVPAPDWTEDVETLNRAVRDSLGDVDLSAGPQREFSREGGLIDPVSIEEDTNHVD